MTRKPMQDIVPKGKSIRNIPVPETRTKAAIRKEEKLVAEREKELKKDIEMKQEAEAKLKEDIIEEREQLDEDASRREALRQAREEFEETRSARPRKAKKRNRTIVMAVVGIVVVIGLALLITSALHSATITVTPRTLAFTANGDIVAKKGAATGTLAFLPITASETASEAVRAAGQKQVTTRATGTIVIYNNYSSAPQRLIKNTRFATPEGLIFRISDSVTVPGKKGATPGSVEAQIIADEAGPTYNVGLKDFTIPGFKGDPRYQGFYGRSKTPIAGGFSGIQKIVADADRAKAKSDIESRLATDLAKQVAAQKGAGQVVFPGGYTIDYTALPDDVSGDQVTVKEQGTITAAAFDGNDLSAALASTYIKDYKGDPITVQNIEGLAFSPKDFKPASSDSISFHLSGNGVFEWLYDEAAFKNALKGQSRSSTPSILQKFPMIEKADISIRPFWSGSFPGSPDKIAIKKAI